MDCRFAGEAKVGEAAGSTVGLRAAKKKGNAGSSKDADGSDGEDDDNEELKVNRL